MQALEVEDDETGWSEDPQSDGEYPPSSIRAGLKIKSRSSWDCPRASKSPSEEVTPFTGRLVTLPAPVLSPDIREE
jgi:hypothetical protein